MPLVNISEIIPMIRAGADEFYFGFDLNRITDDTNCLNFMPSNLCNFRSLEDVNETIGIASCENKKIYVCFNNEFYLKNQYKTILNLLERMRKPDGIIVTDRGLIAKLRKSFASWDIILSTRANVFNSQAVEYFISLGVKRIALPRHLYLSDIINLIKKYKECEFEVFMKNENCPYINGLCTYTHNIWNEPSGAQIFCRGSRWERENMFYRVKKGNDGKQDNDSIGGSFKARLAVNNCGVCSLFDLVKHGKERIILKLTSRLRSFDNKIKDLEFIKAAIRLTDNKIPKKKFIGNVIKLYKEIYQISCSRNCFYDAK